MRKILLALSTVFLLASFTNSADKTIVLKDIDGTLLQSYAVINQVNDEYTVTFTTDATTVVTSSEDNKGMTIHLVENGNSNSTVTHTLTINATSLSFINYLENNFDIASGESMLSSSYSLRKKPPTVIL